MFYKYYVYK